MHSKSEIDAMYTDEKEKKDIFQKICFCYDKIFT